MKIKISFISSSFDSTLYPKGIACVECYIQNENHELTVNFVRKAEDLSFDSLVENDNICQQQAIQKALEIIKLLDNPNITSEYLPDKTQNKYKQKVIELLNLLNWSTEKFSKFVQKYKNMKISELKDRDWYQLYQKLQQYVNHNSNVSSLENIESELIKPEEWNEII